MSLLDIKCSNTPSCTWTQHNNLSDPFCPALAAASQDVADPTQTLPLLDPDHKLAHIPASELPKCSKCGTGLQRPGVVWFGELLDEAMLDEIDEWIAPDDVNGKVVDVVLVIGTSSVVYPAAGYAEEARGEGTSVVTVNLDAEKPEQLRYMVGKGNFCFWGVCGGVVAEVVGAGYWAVEGGREGV
ncbi:DHS-like NAD/FAD-binding domain-containing protein [Bombardia bombarda]|uniref:DHS-like NAD/FAD-binding domain-containing protein n=1 Tax=Bombardia bombarda TaxID=252184 RepID=A0AA39X911_9PEZI|nr:DHS-like NAD/FAD-binding domain-containing protein [Bombardia bombarda]